MTIFDLLFLLAILASVVTLVLAVVLAVRGRLASAFKILRIYAIGALAYLAGGIAVSYLKPQKVLRVGEPWCFDDWCLTVNKVSQVAGPTDVSYRVEFTILSRAGRISQRANGAWMYLIDDRAQRYTPDPDPSAVPLNVLLQPDETVQTSRVFQVPNNVRELGLVTGHGGSYCGAMAFAIIGQSGCLFGKPTVVRIQ